MRILGISCYFHDASAALLEDGVLIAAAEEERFTRVKHDYGFPHQAIRFCLDHAGIEGPDLDYVVFFEKPFVKLERIMKTTVAGFPKTYPMFVQSMRTWLFDKLWVRTLIEDTLKVDKKRILFSEHHVSHAASAYFCSPFGESAILTFDGVGEWATTTLGVAAENTLNLKRELRFPHSIGLLYSTFTAFLGFEVNEGEYKVMGMAPYGSPRYFDQVRRVVHQSDDGSIWLDPSYFSFQYSTSRSFTRKFENLFGTPRDPSVPFFTEVTGYPSYYGDKPRNYSELLRYNQHYADLAASIQLATEEVILNLAREVHKESGSPNLCLAGGVALNSVANARILSETPFESLYVQPSAGDGGGSLGATLFAWHCVLGNNQRFVMDHAYWGKDYEPQAIAATVESAGIKGQQVDDRARLLDEIVRRLCEGKVVGWLQGRFEWGPRALGNRSILADPRHEQMKDIVNSKIKFREPFRPFAPAVLADKAVDYFQIPENGPGMPERFMLLVVPVLSSTQNKISAVNHMGTSRIQTVYRETNSLFYELIDRFGKATGVPLLLNTSFNVRGEPIVNSPEDALNTFSNSGLDTLVMDNWLIDKT